ncbi:MAG: hypothetical protein ACJA01_003700 [Saprospiraceae bacterium]|jgi:hypothetical protein
MNHLGYLFSLIILVHILSSCQQKAPSHPDPLKEILASGDSTLTQTLQNAEALEIQIRYTQIDRDANNNPILTSFSFREDQNKYFYPASTVKMPVAFLALQRLNKIREETGNNIIDRHSRLEYGAGMTPQVSMLVDSSSPSGYPQVAHFIEQVFSVSDNEAYNRLYEFLGQDYINEELKKKGVFKDSRIRTRVGIGGYDTEANKYTNPVKILSDDGNVFLSQDEYYALYNEFPELKETSKGVAYYDDHLDTIVQEAFDMSAKNFISLRDLEASLLRVIFPNLFNSEEQFHLSEEQYEFLYRTMPMPPLDFSYHQCPEHDYYDSYVKFFYNGDSHEPIPDHIRIFNKVGWAYGTLTDCSFIIDTKNKVEFFLAATILTNENQTFNDGKYEYKEVGMPFFSSLGRAIYQHELKRRRVHKPEFGVLVSN